ncbi:MAG: helix-turn-helix transcriptional regulator [Oxalicibacterium faecigallinarum]|uniref:helix-turn-helix domain-containing protein n=1 Tax=Oxalicibacterium faecigallinarum TaxID=573741 RepID=UPI00280712D6|nr:helix-turn-helix transcriptional regulator [Oxalicibacterium faecigallinarum]MDQ7969677.1 helix-turn-helix transcriptional regulator [Oxalicibacterium faecigallinarum]
MDKLCSSFGLTVRQLREARGWSQEALAEKAHLNRSYVGDVERGNAVPSLVTLEKIAVALGLKISDLLVHCEKLRGHQIVYNLNLAAIAC